MPNSNFSSQTLREVLKSQYHGALATLRECVERCPEDEWSDLRHTNAFWQIAYHTLYFTHLYLSEDEHSFVPWTHHQDEVQHPDAIAGPADPDSPLPLVPLEYSKQQVLEYWTFCDDFVDEAVDALDLNRPESGFDWYRMSKLEHQIVNIRHVQHHAAQLADRLRAKSGIGIAWVDGGRRY